MKRNLQAIVLLGVVAGVMGLSLLVMRAGQPSLRIAQANPHLTDNKMPFKLQMEGGTTGAVYVIQSSSNLSQWQGYLSGKSKSGAPVTVGEVLPTNRAQFFRVRELGPGVNDTNPPSWTNGMDGKATIGAGVVTVSWDAAADDVGVSEYRLFVNGVQIATVPATSLSYILNINWQKPQDIRIQAADASGNLSPVMPLSHLPGNGLLAVSDDSGWIYTFDYYHTNAFQTNAGFGPLRQVVRLNGYARGIALGDFDRDGILDLVSGGADGDALTPYFLKGNGDGSFGTPVPLPRGAGSAYYMMDMAVGDFDADGNLDFIVNGNSQWAYLYWGNGNGTFSLEVQDRGAYGRGMSAGDFDEDGREDFVRGTSDGKVRVFLSNGDRTFTQLTATNTVGQSGSDPYGVVAGDFNEDGHLDVMENSSDTGDITFFEGLGDATFQNLGEGNARTNLDLDNFGGMDTFDFDGDGHLDLVMVNFSGHSVYFWSGLGGGSFSTNRVALTTNLGNALGISAPPHLARVELAIAPLDPVINLNGTLTFNALGAGVKSNDFFRWTFGDTGTNPLAWTFETNMANTGPSVSHTYTNEGRFVTRLWHTDARGIQSVRGTWVTVKAEPPTADPGGPYSFGEGAATQTVWYATLDGSKSKDDFGIVSYIWDFGDGSSITNHGPTVTHAWTNAGLWTVNLTVVDAARQTNSRSTTVKFTAGREPVAVISGQTLIDEHSASNGIWSATFYGTNSTDDFGIWKYDWDFGGGRRASGPIVKGEFTTLGTNLVTLTVTDNAGQTNTAKLPVLVKANAFPVPIIKGPRLLSVTESTNGLWYGTWEGGDSTDDAGISSYVWSFGDGITGSGRRVSHAYAGTGFYSLTLSVTDNANQSVSTTQNVTAIAGNPPLARINENPLTPEFTQPIKFSAAESTSDNGIYQYLWHLPSKAFLFSGQNIDTNQWTTGNATQDNGLTVNQGGALGYFFAARDILLPGSALEGRIDTPISGGQAMVGFRNLDRTSGEQRNLDFALDFVGGTVSVIQPNYEVSTSAHYTPGGSYDYRIETKTTGGARYFLRPSDSGQAFTLIFETNDSYNAYGYGALVLRGEFRFRNLVVEPASPFRDFTTSVFPGGVVSLTVTDSALLTNSTSVLISPMTGAPPIAVLSGPIVGQKGIGLTYNAYGSSNLNAVASYSWDFGDGTPVGFGSIVGHVYQATGHYTNHLTITDYAGRTSSSLLPVDIFDSNSVVHVPWKFIRGVELPHSTYSGKTITLKAVARGIEAPFSYVWDFGDGSAKLTNSVTNSAEIYNLEAQHVFTGQEGNLYSANVTVLPQNEASLSDSYPLILRAKTLEVEIDVAIDEALWFLHKSQERYNLGVLNKGGDWTNSFSMTVNATASAVQAFGINGHALDGDAIKDPYVETVSRGVNGLLSKLAAAPLQAHAPGELDGNHNLIGLTVFESDIPYQLGCVMDAFVAVAQPDYVALVGSGDVQGRALKDIMQDMVDMYCSGQNHYTNRPSLGGWRYDWGAEFGSPSSDNSASQWAAIGLAATERYWGISAPKWVKDFNLAWVSYSAGNGGFGYTGPGDGYGTTPGALVQLAWQGISRTNSLWLNGENYIATNWNKLVAENNLYNDFGVAKAMRLANPPVQTFSLTGLDWFKDPTNGLGRSVLDQQHPDGSWTGYAQPEFVAMSTAWSTIILSSSLFQRGPKAIINASPNPSSAGYPVVLDGRSSYHEHPAFQIIEYRWVFNSERGADFDHPDAIGPVVTNIFPALSTNKVSLQVRDNGTPQLSDIGTLDVMVTVAPHAPTANAGGPYVVCVGEDVHLDGSDSFDVDQAQGDRITSYDWEINNQLPYDFNDGLNGKLVTLVGGYPTSGHTNVELRVSDASSLVFSGTVASNLTSISLADIYVYNRLITNLQARAKANEIQLTWPKTGDYAVVERSSEGPDRHFSEIGRTENTYATFLDTNIDYGTRYYYRVFAYEDGKLDPLGISDPVFIMSLPRTEDARAPRFTVNPERAAFAGSLYQVHLSASPSESQPFAFNVLCGPTNLFIDSSSGLLRFFPKMDQLGSQSICLEVTNSYGRDELDYTLVVFAPTNHPPVPRINAAPSGFTGQMFNFSSAGTFDPEGDSISYLWNFGDGTPLDTNANPTHVFNSVGSFFVGLFASDTFSNTALALTNIVIARGNRQPVAVAGPNQTAYVGEVVQLDGSRSYDLDPQQLSYRWDLALRPTNSIAALSDATTTRPSFLVDQPGTYVAKLIVNDGIVDSAPDGVVVSTANSPPVAFAGRPQHVSPGTTVTLDGTGSYDVDHNLISYRWTIISAPTNSSTTLKNSDTPTPSFLVDADGLYLVQLVVNDGLIDSAPSVVQIATMDFPPVITSVPTTNAIPGVTWTYSVDAFDPVPGALNFTLVDGPAGMSFGFPQLSPTNSILSWTPKGSQLGTFPVTLRVSDASGLSALQSFSINVAVDTDPPVISLTLLQGEIQPGTGQWAAKLGTTVVVKLGATDNVGVTSTALRLANNPLTLNSGGASFVASNAGLWTLTATASDAAGNLGITNKTILFYDPDATNTIYAKILSPAYDDVVTKPVPVICTITNTLDLLSYRVDFARASEVDLANIAFEGPQFTTLTNVILPPGVKAITNTTLAQFDPTILINDDYIIRLVASDGQNLFYEPVLISVTGKLKLGELHLEFTDLSVPVAGIPITVTRVYDSRNAKQVGDFGYGWNLGIQDARIRKTLRSPGWTPPTMFPGSRVYINTPDGRRVGFTSKVDSSAFFGFIFVWLGLEPDPGVYEKLEIVGNNAFFQDGYFLGGLADASFNPSTFRLTTKDGTVYTYDDIKGLENIQDLNGNSIVYTKDGIYHFSSGGSEPDQQIHFVRDAQGRISQIIDPSGKSLTYGYDAWGDLRSFTDQASNLTQYAYSRERAHYLTNFIDALGHNAMQIVYGDDGRLLGIRDANGHFASQQFPDPNTTVFTDANGNTNIVSYDDNGNEVMRAVQGIYTNYFGFDANNNQVWHQDPRGYVTWRGYDTHGNLTQVVDAESNITSIVYSALNKPTSVTDALGHTTQFGYDERGELTNVINALNGQASFTRDAQGRVTSTTDFNGHTTFYDYAGGCSCGKPGKVTNPDGTFRLYEYNTRGQTTREINELGYETLSLYDDVGRLLWVRDAESNYTHYGYAGSLKISETDPLGRTTLYGYDSANRLTSQTNAMGGVVRFQYDNGTNRIAVIDPVGNVTRFYYDAANRLKYQVDPWGRTNFFAYDAAGNRIEALDRNLRRRTFGYDSLNRRTNELWWEGTNVVRSMDFVFNALGTMTGASDPASHLTFEFDELNRLRRASQSGITNLADFILSYVYDGMTNVLSVKDNVGVEVVSTYDSRNRLEKRIWQGGDIPGVSLSFNYDAAGNRTNIFRYADATGTVAVGQSLYFFTPVGLISDILHETRAKVKLAEYHYRRDSAQQIIQRILSGQTADYKYDWTGQLTNAFYSIGQPNEGYEYDDNGNRISAGYLVTTNNQLTADATNTYSYDCEGSLIIRSNTVTRAKTAYRYDHRNRLITVMNQDGSGTLTQTVYFGYDALNRRITKSVNDSVTHFLLNQEDIWADAATDGSITNRYLLSNRIDEMLARSRIGGTLVWYLADNLGTARDLVNSTGQRVNHLTYDCFGRILDESNPLMGDRFLFTGREWDGELAAYCYRARYYAPDLGRFQSQDPVGFYAGDANLFRYSANAPLESLDPLGTIDTFEFVLLDAHAGGASAGANAAVLSQLSARAGSSFIETAISDSVELLAGSAEGSFANNASFTFVRSALMSYLRNLPGLAARESAVASLEAILGQNLNRAIISQLLSGLL